MRRPAWRRWRRGWGAPPVAAAKTLKGNPCPKLCSFRNAQASLAALEARLERVRLSAPPVAAAKTLVCCELPDGARRAWVSWTVAGALSVCPASALRMSPCPACVLHALRLLQSNFGLHV